MISFLDFVQKYNLKNKATSILKYQQIPSSLCLNVEVTCLKDGPFPIKMGIANLQPTKGTHWVAYIGENCFISYGKWAPEKLSKCILKQN